MNRNNKKGTRAGSCKRMARRLIESPSLAASLMSTAAVAASATERKLALRRGVCVEAFVTEENGRWLH